MARVWNAKWCLGKTFSSMADRMRRVNLAVREVVHGRPVKNADALANPEALALFRDLPELNG